MVNSVENKNLLTAIGAPEIIIKLSKSIMDAQGTHTLSKEEKEKLEKVLTDMSLLGQRVIAIGINIQYE